MDEPARPPGHPASRAHGIGLNAENDAPRERGSRVRGEHVVWHQDLVCPGDPCQGRVRRFPSGVLIDEGRRERRRCPVCRAEVAAPAFYLADSVRGSRPPPARPVPARSTRPRWAPHRAQGRSRPAASDSAVAGPSYTLGEAVNGARIITVVAPINAATARRLRRQVVRLLRTGGRPLVVDLHPARGTEAIAVNALRDLATRPHQAPGRRSAHSDSDAESSEVKKPGETAAAGLRLVLDPAAVPAWVLVDPTAVEIYPTLAAALEP